MPRRGASTLANMEADFLHSGIPSYAPLFYGDLAVTHIVGWKLVHRMIAFVSDAPEAHGGFHLRFPSHSLIAMSVRTKPIKSMAAKKMTMNADSARMSITSSSFVADIH
jgi:hypothetical protein